MVAQVYGLVPRSFQAVNIAVKHGLGFPKHVREKELSSFGVSPSCIPISLHLLGFLAATSFIKSENSGSKCSISVKLRDGHWPDNYLLWSYGSC